MRISRLTVSLISVDSAAGFAENQEMAAATKIAGSQESSFAAVGYSFLSFIFPLKSTEVISKNGLFNWGSVLKSRG